MTVRVEQFFAPKLIGKRFDNHSIPVDVLQDLAILEPMILEISKKIFMERNRGRQRAPRNFGKNISISLAGVDNGSAIPNLTIEFDDRETAPPLELDFFLKAKEKIIQTVRAAATGGDITEYLEPKYLGYFDKLGRNLREGESIDFSPAEPNSTAILDRSSREKLVAASRIKETSEQMILRGGIEEFDQVNMSCELCLASGQRIQAPVRSIHFDTVMDAFNKLQDNIKVAMEGVVRLDQNRKYKYFEEIEHIQTLEPNDVAYRLEELSCLADGWLDGKGKAPAPTALKRISNILTFHYPEDLPEPFIYPTPEGNILAEWDSGSNTHICMEINLETQVGDWEELNTLTDEENNRTLELSDFKSWEFINRRLSETIKGE